MWAGLQLRFELEGDGLALPKCFHATDDNRRVRVRVFDLIVGRGPRFDTTFLAKERAYAGVRARGQTYFYQLAWFLHVRTIAAQVSSPGDTLYVIASTLQTNKRKNAVREALKEVCPGPVWSADRPVRLGRGNEQGPAGG